MFGTLTCHPQEPLTFVENVDLASALNRNRRDCPHISCESCRQKKIKCNGDPDGCDKCAVSSINCQYAVRDARRRKKRTATGDYNVTDPLNTNLTNVNGNDCQSQQILEQMQQRFGNGGSGQSRNSNNSRKTLHPTNDTTQQDMDCDMMQAILDNNSDYTQWYPPRPTAPTKSISDSGIGIEDWASITTLTDQAVPMNFDTDWIDTGLGPGDVDKGTTDSSDDWNNLDSRLMTLNNSHGPATTSTSTSKSHSLSSRASITDHGQREQNRRLRSRTEVYDEDDLPFQDGSSWQPSPTSMSSSTRKSVKSRDGSMLPSGSDVLQQSAHRRGGKPPPTQGHSPGDCHCLTTTAALLNELDGRSADYGTESVDVLLGYLRKALKHCRSVLDCGICASRGEIVMILAMASQYMRVMAESVASHCIWLQEESSTASAASPPPPPPPSWTRNFKENNNAQHDMSSRDDHFGAQKAAHDDDTPSSGDAIDNMWFSTYRIESHDERLYVLTTLVLVQITNLVQLLGMLKQRCDGRKGPLSLVQGAEKRCNEVSETLRERVFSRGK